MKIIFTMIFLLISISKLFAQKEPEIEKIVGYWREERYNKVISAINDYYGGNKSKHTLMLDILMVTSLCNTGSTNPNPKQCFDLLKKSYRASEEAKAIIEKLSANCSSMININKLTQNYTLSTSNQFARTRGKLGYSTSQSNNINHGDTLKILRYITDDDLNKRRLKRGQGIDAGIFYKRLYDSIGLTNYRIKVLDKFIIVTTSSDSMTNYKDSEIKLNAYLSFYAQMYGMIMPEDYITIFLAKNINEFRYFSEKLHGFVLPSHNFGYSSLDDQCVVSIAPEVNKKPILGTTCHELFHILSKSNYSTLPAWLEEGMASLYEASELRGNKVVGINNWRIDFLFGGHWEYLNENKINRNLMGTNVMDIIELDWESFNKVDEYEANQSFNYAYSRYLMLYLQNKGNLPAFFKEASAYSYMDIKKSFSEDYFDLIKKYSPPGNDFDKAFKDWVKTMFILAKSGVKDAKTKPILTRNNRR